jgi:chromosome segregation ATPase
MTDIDNSSRSDWTPRPDPTVLTTEQLTRGLISEREYVDGQISILRERLQAIDAATELRLGGIIDIPNQIDEKVNHLGELTTERFKSVQVQFEERDTRTEREARDNKLAVDAAFAAQEKQAVAQNESNTLAITKSEIATTETIKTLAELFRSTTDALGDKVDDLKDRVGALESRRQGATEVIQERQSVTGLQIAAFAAFMTFVLIVSSIIIKFA